MKNEKIKYCVFRVIDVVAVLVLAGVYGYAGIMKFLSPQAFADAIDGYELPLGGLVPLVALALPPLEISAALGLFWRRTQRAALFILGALTMLFLVLLAQAALRGLEIGCGCFGEAASEYSLGVGMVRNVVLLVLAAWVSKPAWRGATK